MKDKSPIDPQTYLYNASSFGTIHLGRWQIFTIFEPYSLPSSIFYYPPANLTKFGPLPLKYADVLNGWSLS